MPTSFNSRLNNLEIELQIRGKDILDKIKGLDLEIEKWFGPRARKNRLPIIDSNFGIKLYHELIHCVNYWCTTFGSIIQNLRIQFFLKSGRLLKSFSEDKIHYPIANVRDYDERLLDLDLYETIFDHFAWEFNFINYQGIYPGSILEAPGSDLILSETELTKGRWRSKNYNYQMKFLMLFINGGIVPALKILYKENSFVCPITFRTLDEFIGHATERNYRMLLDKKGVPDDDQDIKYNFLDLMRYELPYLVADYIGIYPIDFAVKYKVIQLAIRSLFNLNDKMEALIKLEKRGFNAELHPKNKEVHPGLVFLMELTEYLKYPIPAVTLNDGSGRYMSDPLKWKLRPKFYDESISDLDFFKDLFSSNIENIIKEPFQFQSGFQYLAQFYNSIPSPKTDLFHAVHLINPMLFPIMIKFTDEEKNIYHSYSGGEESEASYEDRIRWLMLKSIIVDLTWDTNHRIRCFFKRNTFGIKPEKLCSWTADHTCGIICPHISFKPSKKCPFEEVIHYLRLDQKTLIPI